MTPDQLLLHAVLMPAAAAISLLLVPLAPRWRGGTRPPGPARRQAWLSGAACAAALSISLVVTDGWPWASAWSSWKLIHLSAAIVAAAGAVVCIRGVPISATIAIAAAAAVLWYRVPEAKEFGVRALAAALAAIVSVSVWRGARRAPAWCCAASALQSFVLAGLVGSSGSSKVAAASAAVAVTLSVGAVATRASRTFSCASAAALASGGIGVALALYGRGYHGNIAGWVWWGVAALPGALCLPWALAPGVTRAGAGIHGPGHHEPRPAKRAPESIP